MIGLLLLLSPAPFISRPIPLHQTTMNNVLGWFTLEKIVLIFFGKMGCSIHFISTTTGPIVAIGLSLAIKVLPIRIDPAFHPPRVRLTDAETRVVVHRRMV